MPVWGQAQTKVPVSNSFASAIGEGRKYLTSGKIPEATHAFARAARDAEREGNSGRQAQALVLIVGCEIRLYHYPAGLRTAKKARELALKAGDTIRAGQAAGNISTIYSQLGDFEAAKASADEAIKSFKDSPRTDQIARAIELRGEIEFGLGQDQAARNSYTQAIALARSIGKDDIEAEAADGLGIWLLLKGELKDAEAQLTHAFEIRTRLKDNDGLAISYEHLAELESKKGKLFLQSALTHINQAFNTLSLTFRTSPQYYPLHTRAKILRDLGEDSKAVIEFRKAVDSADIWRQSALPGDTTNTKTVQMLNETYRDFADLAADQALKRNDQVLTREALDVLARNRAASLREQLRRAYRQKLVASPEYFPLLLKLQEAQARATLSPDPKAEEYLAQIRGELSDIENRIGIESQNLFTIHERTSHRNSLRDIQTRLGNNDALLSFSLGDRKSFLWAVTKDDLKLYELPDEKTISRQIPGSSNNRNAAYRMAESKPILDSFSRMLFGKLASSIWQKRNWVITADGRLLDSVPFPALSAVSSSGTVRSLLAEHSLRFLPSELLLLSAKAAQPAPRFVGVADPIYNRADPRRDRSIPLPKAPPPKSLILARLVGSDMEITHSAEASGIPTVERLIGRNASGAKLREALKISPEILHFAVHVVSPEKAPSEAALVVSLTKDGIPELLTAESVATYHVPGSLVVMSGCSTQQGNVVPGAGLVGLSRAWLLAGASAVVVSAWPTPDNSGQFFSTFYTHYKQAAGSVAQRAAAALQQTQLDMQQSGAEYNKATFWAAYSIVSKE